MSNHERRPGTLGVVSNKFGGIVFLSLDGETTRTLPMPSPWLHGRFEMDVRPLVASMRAIQAEHDIRLIVMEKFSVTRKPPACVRRLESIYYVYEHVIVKCLMMGLGLPMEFREPKWWHTYLEMTLPPAGKAVVIDLGSCGLTASKIARSPSDRPRELKKALCLAEAGRRRVLDPLGKNHMYYGFGAI